MPSGRVLCSFLDAFVLNHQAPQLADGCACVFLDIGTNQGIQTRKLFEPELHPEAKWPAQFKKSFEMVEHIRANCCSFGLEPNPLHHDALDEVEAAHNKKRWRTKFFHAAAWTSDGTLTYCHEFAEGKSDGHELSSRLAPG
jgi:hypothetical protein